MFRNWKRVGWRIPIAMAFAVSCSSEATAKKPPKDEAPSGYTLVALDASPGFARSVALDVETSGGVTLAAGNMEEADEDKAMLWRVTLSDNGYQVETHYLPGGSYAAGVNAHGEAVGARMTIDSELQTWVYEGLYWPSINDMPVLLAPLPGDNGAAPWKINNAGLIVGRSIRKYKTTNEAGETEIHEETTAAFWSTGFVNGNGELVAFELSDQPSVFSVARDINQCNEDGIAQVVGIVQELGPALWLVDRETLVAVGPIVLTPDDMRGWALGINNAGDACGDHGAVPYRVLADGTHEELAIRRNFWADANDIGENRLVVGIVWEFNNTGGLSATYGVLWKPDGTRVSLNKYIGRSGWRHIHEGIAIDATGVIAAKGLLYEDHESRAMLMVPND